MLADIRNYAGELKQIKEELQIDKFNSDKLEELLSNWGTADFEIDLDGGVYRFILESDIDEIYEDEIKQLIENCYLQSELPCWVVIDWTQTAQNCLADGYGHTFSSYDGSKYEIGTYYVFRVS